MILTLFLALLALSGFIVWLGYYSDDEPYLPVGLFFFFLLGMVILNGNLQYETGNIAATTYTYNGTTVTQTSTTITDQYTSWSDQNSHWFGWTFSVLSACAFGLSLFNLRRGKGDDYLP